MVISQSDAKTLYDTGHISADLYSKLIENKEDAHEQDKALVDYGHGEMQSQDEIPNQSDKFYPVSKEDMEKQRTFGTDAPVVVPAKEPEYKGPNLSFKIGQDKDQDELTGFQRGIGTGKAKGPVAPPPNAGEPGFIGPVDPGYDASRVREAGVPWKSDQANYPIVGGQVENENDGTITKTQPVSRGPADLIGPGLTAIGREVAPGLTNAIAGKEARDPNYVGPQKTASEKEQEAEEASRKAPPGTLPSDIKKSPPPGMGSGGIAPSAPSKIPGIMDEIESASNTRKTAAGMMGASDIAQSQEEARLYSGAGSDLIKRETDSRLQDEQNARDDRKRLADIERFGAQIRNTKIDEKKTWVDAWAESSTANKIVSGLGILFGVLGAGGPGDSHGQNYGIDAIQKGIDRDIDAQKANLANSHASYGEQLGVYKDYLNLTKDRHIAESASRVHYWEDVRNKASEISARFKGPQAAATATDKLGILDGIIAKEKLNLALAVEGRAKGVGSGGSKGDGEAFRWKAQEELKDKLPAMDSAIDDVESYTKRGVEPMGAIARDVIGAADRIPLVGAVAKSIYGSSNPEAVAAEQSLQNLASLRWHRRTGAAGSEEEVRRETRALFGDGSPAAIAKGISMVKKETAADHAALNAAMSNTPGKSAPPGRGATQREEAELRTTEERRIQKDNERRSQGPVRPGAK